MFISVVIYVVSDDPMLTNTDFEENGYEIPQDYQQQQQQPMQLNGNGLMEPKKVPLKLLMDPRHVQDMNTMSTQVGYEAAPMSPEFGYEIVNALNATKGKGILTKSFKLL